MLTLNFWSREQSAVYASTCLCRSTRLERCFEHARSRGCQVVMYRVVSYAMRRRYAFGKVDARRMVDRTVLLLR